MRLGDRLYLQQQKLKKKTSSLQDRLMMRMNNWMSKV